MAKKADQNIRFSLESYKERIRDCGEATLRIKVHAAARETSWREIMADGTIKIDVAKPAVEGKANHELLKYLAREFSLPVKCFEMISGKNSRCKIIKIKNI